MRTREEDTFGLRLLKEGRKSIFRMIFSRTGLISGMLIFNFLLLFAAFFWLEDFLPHIYGGTALFILIMVFVLFNTPMEPTAKLTWLALIMLMPVFGCLFFLYTKHDLGHRAMVRQWKKVSKEGNVELASNTDAERTLGIVDSGAAAMARYVGSTGRYPVYTNTQVQYFPTGKEKFQALLTELNKAERFIFLEYFIIEEGYMWGKILELLAQKAAQGVEVRVMYDGTCEFALLPKSYPKKLKALGIQCRVFAPVAPFISTHYNYRDHRKIVVIDGRTAFTGGINLADEYIGRKPKFGDWKDTAVMLRGEAANSFTMMFLQMWAMHGGSEDLQAYLPAPPSIAPHEEGFVMPYGESPLDAERTGQQIYVDILNRAQRYVHIMTPYLILNAEVENALTYAAKRGVQVTLILPGIPDKKIPYALAKTHYKALLEAGVQIYEYTPGFIHAKVFVCDDWEAVVGTINLDYRSLYHHFECAAYMHSVACISEIEKDFQETMQKCRQVTFKTHQKEPLSRKLLGYIFKVVAPLM